MAYSVRSVFKGATIYSVGQVLTQATAFVLIPLYTRFLSPHEYGITGYVGVLFTVLNTVLMLGLYGAQTRFYYDYRHDRRALSDFLFSINIFLAVLLGGALLLLDVLGGAYSALIIKNADITFDPYIRLTIWSAFFHTFNQIMIAYYLAAKKYRACALLQAAYFLVVTLTTIFFIVYLQQGAVGKIRGVFWGEVAFFVCFYWLYARRFSVRFVFGYVRDALEYGVPVMLHLLANTIHLTVSRFILERHVSLAELGIFTLGYNLGLGMNVLIVSVNKAWMPNYFDLMKDPGLDRNHEIRKAFYLWFLVMGTACLVGQLWAREFIFLAAPAEYKASVGIIGPIIFAYFVNGLYFFFSAPIHYFKKTRYLPFMTGASAVFSIVCNWLMISHWGIIGAVYANVLSFTMLAVMSYWVGGRIHNPDLGIGKIMILTSLLFILGFAGGRIDIGFSAEALKTGMLAGFICIVLFISRKQIPGMSAGLAWYAGKLAGRK